MDLDNTKLSFPGPNWTIRWLDGPILDYLQLDVVGFLAILGEDAVKATSKLASLSWLFCLPRLMPAPHCLLYSERPQEHEVVRARVTGVRSGLNRYELSSITAALFAPMPAYTVRCFELVLKGETPTTTASPLRVPFTSPVVLVNLFGFALSIALFIASLVYGDGFSLVATVLLSVVSTLVGITNHWSFQIRDRKYGLAGMTGDTVIRFPNGSFMVVKCEENIARQLFFPQNDVEYTLRWPNGFMLLSLGGTVILMVSVIMLANARIELQLAWAGAYILLNIGHWLAAALPKQLNWSFSSYYVRENKAAEGDSSNENFTYALWKAIAFSGSTDWCLRNDALPKTDIWDEWLTEASQHAGEGYPDHSRLQKRHSSFQRKGAGGAGEDVVYVFPAWDPKKAWDKIYKDRQNISGREEA